ncbi:MAG TPA: VCBS repeat-containing protein, partial [Candidatus Dormibacteraeota bacterium]|nr:VCBS repeat-containing protein [Candidatus Dormibacteraeota bacterium]
YHWDPADSFALQQPLNHKPNTSRGTQFVDINGDGRVDVVRSVGNLPPEMPILQSTAWLNTGQGFVPAPQLWTLPDPLVDFSGHATGATFADMDGDGLLDLVYMENTCNAPQPPPFCGWRPKVWLNRIRTVGQWAYAPEFASMPVFSGGDLNLAPGTDAVIDMNGDGKADLIRRGPGQYELQVRINTGSGWVVAPENYESTLIGSAAGTIFNYKLEDINRDGLPDLVWAPGTQLCATMPIGINTGKNHVENPDYPNIQAVWHFIAPPDDCTTATDVPPDARWIGDVDGDGFRDMMTPYRARLDYNRQNIACDGDIGAVCACPSTSCTVTQPCSGNVSNGYVCQCNCPSGVTVTNDPSAMFATGSSWTTNGTGPSLSALTDFKPHK